MRRWLFSLLLGAASFCQGQKIVIQNYAQSPSSTFVLLATSHAVSLSWTASTSSVNGYYVYRGTTSGGPYAKIGTVNHSPFTDIAVLSGTTYYYVVSAFNATAESAYSNQVTAVIPGGGVGMGFGHVQGIEATSGASVTTYNATLTTDPVAGNVVCVAVLPTASGMSAITVKDSNNNSYTKTPNSPSTFVSQTGSVWLFYLLAPANATKTLTISWTTSGQVFSWIDEFSVSGGVAAFDKDAAASSSSNGTTINTPSLTPTGTGELLYAAAAAGGTISAPTAGGTLGVWTGAGGAIANGDMAEYDLSVSSAQAVQFTQSPSGKWSAMSMAFTFTAFVGDEDFGIRLAQWNPDPNISVWQ